MSSMFSPSSFSVGSGAGGWGLGAVGLIDLILHVTNSASLSGFLSNVKVAIEKFLYLWITWPGWGVGSLDPPASNKGTLVVRF